MSRRQWKLLGLWFAGLIILALCVNAFIAWVLDAPYWSQVFASVVGGALYSLWLPPFKVVDW